MELIVSVENFGRENLLLRGRRKGREEISDQMKADFFGEGFGKWEFCEAMAKS